MSAGVVVLLVVFVAWVGVVSYLTGYAIGASAESLAWSDRLEEARRKCAST